MDYGNLKVPENVTPEVQAILDSYEARNKEIENAHRKNTGRIWLGSALSGASAHPVFNIPYVGTGLGGALYELGQGITEGDKLPELAKRTGAGFAIGETVGAIPYAGKYANKLSGGKIGNALTAGVEKLASTPLGQKVVEIAPKVEDLLMTDIKAFNPFKQTQTAYHGSPYDFAKFSNKAIGTGEQAQAHGYGHYAAKSKEVADRRYRERLAEKNQTEPLSAEIIDKETGEKIIEPENIALYLDGVKENPKILESALQRANNKKNDLLESIDYEKKRSAEDLDYAFENRNYLKDLKKELGEVNSALMYLEDLPNFDVKILGKNDGQLYKLSIPKDDVMLREDLPFSQQPKAVQEALKNLANTYNDTFDSDLILQSINKNKLGKQIYKDLEFELSPDWQAASEELYNNGIKGISYNGGMDGEARVIFNPDDIDIVRKYYNQPSLGEMLLKKSPNAGVISNYLYDLIIRE
jgi:hypothetical protein